MIHFSRQVARQLRVVLRKMFGRNRPNVRLIAGPEGLRFQAKGQQHAVEYHDPEPRDSRQLVIPFALLEDVQGNQGDRVRVYCPAQKDVLAATWDDRGVERTMQYALPTDDGTAFHSAPAEFTDNAATLITALRDAALCTDHGSSRYALGCIQLRGSAGQITATDGRQLLLQSGFTFGFPDEVLIPSTEVFRCPELQLQDQPVQVGKTDTHVVVRVGPWAFYLDIQKEGRFPRVQDIIPSFHSAQTTLELHLADARFFKEHMTRLPGSSSEQAVTFDCNGKIAVRAKAEDSQPVEIVLTNSTKTGSDVSICLNRRNLASVASLGFDRVYLYGKDSAVLARDEHRSYLFMPLHDQSGVKPSDDCRSIPSPVSRGSSLSRRPYRRLSTSTSTMPTSPMPTNRLNQAATTVPASSSVATPVQETAGASQSIRRRRRKTSAANNVLEQATALRDLLREVLTTTQELVRTLKAERRSQKSLKLALDSLQQLQHAA